MMVYRQPGRPCIKHLTQVIYRLDLVLFWRKKQNNKRNFSYLPTFYFSMLAETVFVCFFLRLISGELFRLIFSFSQAIMFSATF